MQIGSVNRVRCRGGLAVNDVSDPKGTKVAGGCHLGCFVSGRVPRQDEHELILVEPYKSTSLLAVTEAVRGESEMSAISPKPWPRPIVATSTPSRLTARVPSAMR